MDDTSRAGAPPSRPRGLRVAAAVVALEAAGAFCAGLGFVVATLAGRPADEGTALLLAALLVLLGVGCGLVARGLWRCRARARTPAYLVQFFAVVVGVGQLRTLTAVAVVVLAAAVTAGVGLSLPPSRAVLEQP